MKRHHNDGLRKVCDCGRRNWSKCAHSWHLNYKPRGGTAWRLSLDRELRCHIESRNDARTEAQAIRAAIDAGTFRQAPAAPAAELTFADVAKEYRKRHIEAPMRREAAQQIMGWHLTRLGAATVPAAGGAMVTLGSKPFRGITKADVEAVRDGIRAEYLANRGRLEAYEAWRCLPDDERDKMPAPPAPTRSARAGVKQGEVGINRLLARLRHLCTWAIREGYATETPFERHGKTVVKLETLAETARTRRLEPGEEDRLRAAAQPHLRGLIVAALSTGCRLGELLSLQWKQIRHDDQGRPRAIVLDAPRTKTNQSREIPIGPRLHAELEMRKTDPAGKTFKLEHYVFGNELGERIGSIKTAWRKTCRRAGVENLHFHDLRREFASTLLETDSDLHDVAKFLGHANITTTSRYLASSTLRLERALARLEDARAAAPKTPSSEDPARCTSVAKRDDQPLSDAPTTTTVN